MLGGCLPLAGTPGLSACLKDLRGALLDAGKGFGSAQGHDGQVRALREKLTYVAVALREEYRHAAISWVPPLRAVSGPASDDGDAAGCQAAIAGK